MSETRRGGQVVFVNFQSKQMTCPHCNDYITTKLNFVRGTTNIFYSAVLAVLGCGLGCWLIPCFMDRFKDVIHNCPKCNKEIARYKRNDPRNQMTS